MGLRLTKKRRLDWLITSLGVGLIIIGLGLLISYLYWYNTGDEIIKTPKISLPLLENYPIDEQPISPEVVKEYQVSPTEPRYFSMSSLNIDQARIIKLDRNQQGQIDTPKNIFDVGWYQQSGKQDQKKVIFLDGHNGGPNSSGVFKQLPNVKLNDTFSIERGDGLVTNYQVINNQTITTKEFDDQKMSQLLTIKNQKETAVIVSCAGKWIPKNKDYDKRVIVIANRLD